MKQSQRRKVAIRNSQCSIPLHSGLCPFYFFARLYSRCHTVSYRTHTVIKMYVAYLTYVLTPPKTPALAHMQYAYIYIFQKTAYVHIMLKCTGWAVTWSPECTVYLQQLGAELLKQTILSDMVSGIINGYFDQILFRRKRPLNVSPLGVRK